MPDWNYPTAIKFGNGRIKELSKLCEEFNMHCPLIVTDPGLAHFSFMMKIEQSLPCAGIFSAIKANPNGSNIEAGVTAFKHGKHDGIIAIGGGSALDAGKAIALMAGQSQSIWDFEDIGDNWKKVDAARMITTIAIPTTAGTGSEVGRAAVIVNEDSHSKKIIFHPKLMPVTVICDPELTVGMPPMITAGTGMDAFAHCLEAYSSPHYHPMSQGIALEGMRLVKDNLLNVYKDGNDLVGRAEMMSAAAMGATAFQKGLGAIHALSHPIGAVYHTHHGTTNAVVMQPVLNFNPSYIETRIEQ
ncbi:MAG: iron-containing alcohol dehydrogenase, partial [Oleispira sp.]|nr:iron-containing alcohol dehydrogenase [Oleispira sp.]